MPTSESTWARVLLIAPSFEILGGQSVQATRLRAALNKVPGIQVDFQPINPSLQGWLAPAAQIPVLRTLVRFLIYNANLLTRVRDYDILHVFSASYWSYTLWTLPALFYAKLFGKKIVLNYRDGQAEDHLQNWRSAIPTIQKMDAVVAPSGFLVDVFAKFGIAAHAISNIIDVEQFNYKKRHTLEPRVLHNRILEPLYNIPCALKAFKQVQRVYPSATLVVAHDGPLRGELEHYAGEIGLRNFHFVGKIPHGRVTELYDAADIYLTSPNFDCMPGSLLESFASGLPVVATNAGGIPYIATNEETALLVPRDDYNALANAMVRLLENPDLVERLTANAYRHCHSFSEGPVREQWAALYRKLLGLAA